MGLARKFLGCSLLSLGLAAAGLGISADLNVRAKLDGKTPLLEAVDSNLYEYPRSGNPYAHFRAMVMENAIDDRLAAASEDDLMRYLDVDHYERSFGFYSSRSNKIIDSMASLDSERSLEYLVDILHSKLFDKEARENAAKMLYKKKLPDIKNRPDILAKLTQFITPLDREEFIWTNEHVMDILGDVKYRKAVPSLFAVANLDYTGNGQRDLVDHASTTLANFPSRPALDVLINMAHVKAKERSFDSANYADNSLKMAENIGMRDYACSRLYSTLEYLKPHRILQLFSPNVISLYTPFMKTLQRHNCAVDDR